MIKKMLICLILFICFTSCNKESKENKENKESVVVEQVSNDKVTVITADSLQTNIGKTIFTFKFVEDAIDLKAIRIYSQNQLIQTIQMTYKPVEDKKYEFIDWNFDGYKDITLLFNRGSGGNAYWIWNYNPKEKKFFYNEILSERLGLEIDSKTKSIIFHYRFGYEYESWDTLQYVKDSLVFTKGVKVKKWTDNGVSWKKTIRIKKVNNSIVREIDSVITN